MSTALIVQDLKKTYSGGFQALKGISFEVQSGDFMALLGPNGAGKSTTIGIISSLVNKTSGSVSIYGKDIDRDFAAAKMNIGIVPQEFNFNQFEKVGDIVRTQAGYYGLDRHTASERAEKYLKLLDLWEKRDEQSRMLSGGMKRRLMIARALVHEPRLLVLDEPTAGVDIELRRSMWSFLKELNQRGTTIILTTHYLEEAEQLCRSIAIIDHGRIIEKSSMKAFLARLDRETFLLDLSRDIEAVPNLKGVAVELLDPHTLAVEVSKDAPLNAIFEQLSAQGISVTSMRNKANRLEELFVSLVERKQ
ncbi:MAG: ABC transporter [Pseudomonadales bacterium]|jgi:ABC-2 type transport system ATP-binding protein|uniref:ABC transporter ATP-binding protein n=1 Tax=Roseivirga sp. UBA1976 TaxID=1947386 RepID=UPI000C5D54BF|nr:ABC transporter ATP-binding protein [Roseivirga sp. UBA1976]MAQ26114.1 ABC transporter [Pseudomonadales bacterium]MCK5789526.1 ABC transporter ATP-binding protein [Ketobacter sp.]HAG93596.1 ABC transporter [Gammaproteobacteria bacterium]MBI26542.1 ABC transporter [Pseudomonadales bacterium]HAU12474.1 ABC transporter [Gammaproteobacteria bacterium]|tara:strand:- start:1015 stop:1932 length:918 start_codon:yes stop_codon:yes gene_type:complete